MKRKYSKPTIEEYSLDTSICVMMASGDLPEDPPDWTAPPAAAPDVPEIFEEKPNPFGTDRPNYDM